MKVKVNEFPYGMIMEEKPKKKLKELLYEQKRDVSKMIFESKSPYIRSIYKQWSQSLQEIIDTCKDRHRF